jgi:hypothetical protein
VGLGRLTVLNGLRTGRPLWPLALLVLLAVPACTFTRHVTNPDAATLEPFQITLGQTTWTEVMALLGPPAPADPMQPNGAFGDHTLRYVVQDERCTACWLVITRPEWCDTQKVFEMLIEFDEDDLVIGVWRSARGTIRPPFQDEDDRMESRTQGRTR